MRHLGARRPIGIGVTYPADRDELLKLLDAFIEEARSTCMERIGSVGISAKSVLIPHGELVVSGLVALAGLACLSRDVFDTIVVVGVNHAGLGLPAAVYPGGYWATPLGEVAVDAEYARLLAGLDEFLDLDEEAHRDEHSVEAVLVLLQYLFGTGFRFVPIVLSDTTIEVARSVSRTIHHVARQLGRRVLLVATTNFGLEPNRARLEHVFDTLLEPLLAMRAEEFYAMADALGIALCNPAVAAIPALYAKLLRSSAGVLIAREVDKSCIGRGYTGYASLAWM